MFGRRSIGRVVELASHFRSLRFRSLYHNNITDRLMVSVSVNGVDVVGL